MGWRLTPTFERGMKNGEGGKIIDERKGAVWGFHQPLGGEMAV